MYITHYKEMGHQRDTMEDCFSKEGTGARLPLPDYVESAAILEEMRAVRQLEAAVEHDRTVLLDVLDVARVVGRHVRDWEIGRSRGFLRNS